MPKDSNILFWTREDLRAEIERLKALTIEMDKTINESQAGVRNLKAEVERLKEGKQS